ncbi:hypothetical protein Atep_09130 [Allochromatium tepidum]|uniref:Transposase IS66 central domain-containing protein n=1 Tax=Allochromatium tepidum TaxID=553982 RepID=A0ABM7QKF9_9GAMM|nr:hypothetical protein Atep_09130 [Allochromatium tepidum]
MAEGRDGVETEASAPAESPAPKREEGKRRAGKQPGAPGFGRTQVLPSLIAALHFRFHLSRRRTQEFLHEWLGVRLSVGLPDQTIREAGAAVALPEAELIEAIVAGDRLHADETSWMVEDLMAIVHTFSCRLYGMRKYKQSIKEDFAGLSLHQPKDLCE